MGIISDLLGVGASIYGAKKSAKAASQANALAREQFEYQKQMDEQALQFAREQYEDWVAVFGDVQKNLGEYYSKLTPTGLTAQGLEAFEREKSAALTALNERLHQRGLGSSGLSTSLTLNTELASAEARARIRAEAPLKAAQEKANFLALGLNSPARTNLQSTLNALSSNAAVRAVNAANLAAGANTAAGAAIGSAIQAGIGVVENIEDGAYGSLFRRSNSGG